MLAGRAGTIEQLEQEPGRDPPGLCEWLSDGRQLQGLGEVGSVVADHSDVLGRAPHAWCMRSRADRYARRSSARWSSYRLSTAQALTPGAP